MRLRVDLSYEGTEFSGWAAQPGLRTVEGELTAALGVVMRTEPPRVTCAGRTDAGVHARGQVVHLDLDDDLVTGSVGRSKEPPVDALRRRLNGRLDPDLRVRRVVEAPEGFDARFSALWRRYAYRICDDAEALDPLDRRHVLAWPRPLDTEAMAEASTRLLGQHDFASYCRQREGATTIRTLLDLTWERSEHGRLTALVRADAFCHGMVRSLVGALLAVGDGRRPPTWPAAGLSSRQRDSSVIVAPAHGLTLEEVAYPPDAEVAARVQLTRTRRVSVDR